MLNEEKIRFMTKAAAFEAREEKKALAMNKYFQGDYISLKLIGAGIAFTLAFFLVAGCWVFCQMDDLIENIQGMDLAAVGRGIFLLYMALLGIFLVIHYVVYSVRYHNNQRKLSMYYKILKRISHIYQKEFKSRSDVPAAEGVERNDHFTGI